MSQLQIGKFTKIFKKQNYFLRGQQTFTDNFLQGQIIFNIISQL